MLHSKLEIRYTSVSSLQRALHVDRVMGVTSVSPRVLRECHAIYPPVIISPRCEQIDLAQHQHNNVNRLVIRYFC